MNQMTTPQKQRGVTLVIGLIMLVLITLMVISAFMLSNTNLKAVGNMQFRDEAIAAANVAIERSLAKTFTLVPSCL
jgi:Tfp pilus assembly protein PilX